MISFQMTKRTALGTVFILSTFSVFYVYYIYNVKQLLLSEIVKSLHDPSYDLIRSIPNLNIKISRADIHDVAKKAKYWEDKILKLQTSKDQKERNVHWEKLVSEISMDPVLMRVAPQLIDYGPDFFLVFVKATTAFDKQQL